MPLWDLLRPETKGVSKAQLAAATSRSVAPASRAGSFSAATFLPNDNVEAAISGHYTRCLWVFRCIDAIAQAEVSIPIYSWDSHDDGARRVEGYEALEQLLNGPKRPNRYEQYWQFRYRVSTLMLLSTRGVFIEVVRDEDTGEPVELHILDTDSVQVKKSPFQYVEYYLVRAIDDNGSITEQKLDPSRILWLRGRPHPRDPYAQVTPLVAAGLSADTDFLARIFNANWLRNDGRPGLLIGVSNREGGGFQPDDLDELKRRFGGGPTRAGETSVIEADVVSVNDMASNPKDAQYQDTLQGSKQEILVAFGVSEPFVSWANGRSWDNAQTEIEVVWENTMRWHCKALASVFMGIVDQKASKNDVVFAHDFSKVRFLHRGPREKAAELRAEYQAGLITADEYRTGTGREAFDVPATKVLWAPSTLTPIGETDSVTTKAQEVLAAARPQQAPVAGALPTAPDGSNGVDPSTQDTGLSTGADGPPQALPPGQPGASNIPVENVARLREQLRGIITPQQEQQIRRTLTGAKARLNRSPERKAARGARPVRRRRVSRGENVIDGEVVGEDWDPDDGLARGAAHELSATIKSWSHTMLTVVDARLDGVKGRRNTRHWDPSAAEVKAGFRPTRGLNEFYLVQIDRWADQLLADIRFSVRSLASRAMAELRNEIDIDGPGLVRASKQVQDGTNRLSDQFERDARKKIKAIQTLIRRMDRSGADLQEIKDAVAEKQAAFERWAVNVAPKVANTAYNLGRRYMIDNSPSGVATWRTRLDDRVRHGHQEAEGQQPGRGKAFTISGSKLMFPGDTRAPIETWIACRCVITIEPRRR